MNSKGQSLFLLGIYTAVFANVPAPSTDLIINNKTQCHLNLIFEQSLIAEISAPNKVSAEQSQTGRIAFSDSWFSPTSQQLANVQYIVECNNINHVLTLNFYAGYGPIKDQDYYFKASTSNDSPFLVVPEGEVLIQGSSPLTITLINKETNYEATLNSNAPSPNVGNITEGNATHPEPEPMQVDSEPSTEPQPSELIESDED